MKKEGKNLETQNKTIFVLFQNKQRNKASQKLA